MEVGLILIGQTTFLKLGDDAAKLDVGSLPEALSYLVAAYLIFNVQYPDPLKVMFGFFERVMGLPMHARMVKRDARVVLDSITRIHGYLNRTRTDQPATEVNQSEDEL